MLFCDAVDMHRDVITENQDYTLCLKKVRRFYFCDYSVKCWPILIIFGNIAAEKICNQLTYSFLIICSLCMNIYKIEKNERYSVMFSLLPLHVAVVPVSCSFLTSLLSPRIPQLLFGNSLISFFCSITFNNVQIFHQNLIFVAENHVCTKPEVAYGLSVGTNISDLEWPWTA